MPERPFAFAADSIFVQVRKPHKKMQSLQLLGKKRLWLCQKLHKSCPKNQHSLIPWAKIGRKIVLHCNMNIYSTLSASGRDSAA
jgi:hypothetical protein